MSQAQLAMAKRQSFLPGGKLVRVKVDDLATKGEKEDSFRVTLQTGVMLGSWRFKRDSRNRRIGVRAGSESAGTVRDYKRADELVIID